MPATTPHHILAALHQHSLPFFYRGCITHARAGTSRLAARYALLPPACARHYAATGSFMDVDEQNNTHPATAAPFCACLDSASRFIHFATIYTWLNISIFLLHPCWLFTLLPCNSCVARRGMALGTTLYFGPFLSFLSSDIRVCAAY